MHVNINSFHDTCWMIPTALCISGLLYIQFHVTSLLCLDRRVSYYCRHRDCSVHRCAAPCISQDYMRCAGMVCRDYSALMSCLEQLCFYFRSYFGRGNHRMFCGPIVEVSRMGTLLYGDGGAWRSKHHGSYLRPCSCIVDSAVHLRQPRAEMFAAPYVLRAVAFTWFTYRQVLHSGVATTPRCSCKQPISLVEVGPILRAFLC